MAKEEKSRQGAKVPHTQRRRWPVGVNPRKERRQQRAAERLAKAKEALNG